MQSRATTGLQDSTVYGVWKDEYLNYNCYGYAIDYYDRINPGAISGITYVATASISTMASWVKSDLIALGYTVSGLSTTIPSTSVTDHTHVICIRKDDDGLYDSSSGIIKYDFHFMKLKADGNWYHKPGTTCVLKYNYTPTNSRVWISEGYNGESYLYSSRTYESTIYYITYTTPHEWAYHFYTVTDGVCYHINKCTVCGETSGSKIACTYKAGSDSCTVCGQYKYIIVTSTGEVINDSQYEMVVD